jgi:cell division protein ZapA
MAEITLTIGGHRYPLSCGEGEEQALQSLATTIDARIAQQRTLVGMADQSRELLMVALLLADELAEARATASIVAEAPDSVDLVDALDQRTARLTTIAQRLTALGAQAT